MSIHQIAILLAATAWATLAEPSTAISTSTTCTPPGSTELVGRWEPTLVSRGGLGTVMDFRADGTVMTSMAVVIEFRYAVDGAQLHIVGKDGGDPKSAPPVTFSINGDTLRRTGRQGQEEATRIGPAEAGPSSIVGAWRSRHYTGAIAFERFTSDGRLLFRIPMGPMPQCYTIDADGKHLTLISTEKESRLGFQKSGNELQLTTEQSALAFRLSEFGAWYDIDKMDYKDPQVEVPPEIEEMFKD